MKMVSVVFERFFVSPVLLLLLVDSLVNHPVPVSSYSLRLNSRIKGQVSVIGSVCT